MSHDLCVPCAALLLGSADNLSPISSTNNPQRRRQRTLLASCAFAVGALVLSAFPAMAQWSCQSGSLANNTTTFLLTHVNCQANTSGTHATGVGHAATALGNKATAIGESAGPQNAVEGTTTVGAYSGFTLGPSAGLYSTAIGAGFNHLVSPHAIGTYSIAIGGGDNPTRPGAVTDANAVFGIAIGTGAVTVGVRSVSIGAFAGDNAGAGNHRNSAFGTEAGRFVTGAGNTGTGLAAGHTVTGDLNSAFGNSAGQFVTGNNNTAAGVLAGVTVNGSFNAAFGDNAGRDVTGHRNVALGRLAGRNITASDSIAIGTGARATKNRAVAIGQGSIANVVNTVSVGRVGNERRIMNVAAGVKRTDAVNLGQLQAAVAAVSSVPGTPARAVAMPVAPEPPAVSVRQVGLGNERRAINDLQRRVSQLEALVQRQQQLIVQLGSSVATAAK